MKHVLSLPMEKNDANAKTVGDYLIELLLTLWKKGESFSGKRPFGNSGWEYDLYYPLVKAGLIWGEIDEDGYLVSYDFAAADKMINETIRSLWV